MKLRPYHPQDDLRIESAIGVLRHAARMLREAGCPRTLAIVRRALKSADGARRHLQRRRNHAEPR